MGMIFDFLEFLAYETHDLVTGVHEDAKQLGDELIHINDSSYVSPYRMKSEAREKISRADGKLGRAETRYAQHFTEVRDKIQHNNKLKEHLLGRLEGKSESSLVKAVAFRSMEPVEFTGRDDFKMGEFLGFFGSELRRKAANDYLEDAKDYEVEVRGRIAEIEYCDMKLTELEKKIALEERLLGGLAECYYTKTQEQKYQMAKSIRSLMEIEICDSSGNIRQRYVTELDKLSRI